MTMEDMIEHLEKVKFKVVTTYPEQSVNDAVERVIESLYDLEDAILYELDHTQ